MNSPAGSVKDQTDAQRPQACGEQAFAVGAGAETAPSRLTCIDAYRGLVMFLMMAEVLALARVSQALPESRFWALLAHQQQHVPWTGCSLHDLIQPSFSFLVGLALPFSIASRRQRGQSAAKMRLHAFWRALVLVVLGIALRSVGRAQTYFTFEDTLTQIGLGYGFLFLLGERSQKVQWSALAILLAGYWLVFALYPIPPSGSGWEHNLTGFAAHWDKNTNLAWRFDTWFLNLFPRETPFTGNSGGYVTLSFIPTLGTMLLGLIAGKWLRADIAPSAKLRRFLIAGVSGLVLGLLLQWTGICPVVKRIWTPAWTLFSGGWCFLFLSFFYALTEIKGWRRWAFPLVVIGANSIFIYCASELWGGFIARSLRTHLGKNYASLFGAPYAPVVEGACVLIVFWLILLWMYRKKIFIKV